MNATAMTVEQDEMLARWRAMALQRMPYFSHLLFGLRPLNNPGSGTMGVDNHGRLYVDFDAVAPYGDLWCAEALLHECGHLHYEHFVRAGHLGIHRGGRFVSAHAGLLSNLAGDLSINDDLVAVGCTTLEGTSSQDDPPGGVLPKHYTLPDHRTYEFYYRQLEAKSPPPPVPQLGQGDAEAGESGDGSGAGDGSGTGAPQFTTKGCGSGSGNLPLVGELDATDSAGGAAPPMTPAEKALMLDKTAHAITEAAKNRGNLPAGLLAQAEARLAPSVVPWQRVLGTKIRRALRMRSGDADITHRKRDRRRHNLTFGGRKVIVPGTESPAPFVLMVRDTSGSMSRSDLDMVASEAEGICKKVGVKDDDFQIMDVDAVAYDTRRYRGKKTMETISGRGGTDMRVGIAAAYAMKRRPTVCVVATDGFSPFPETPTKGMQVVVCIVGAAPDSPVVKAVPSWITTVCVPKG